MVIARLERDVRRRSARAVTRRAQSHHLGVRLAVSRVPSCPQHDAILHDHRADLRIGRDLAGAALGKTQRPSHQARVVGIHAFTQANPGRSVRIAR